jgi:uncharacterized protein (TIGR00251 family)
MREAIVNLRVIPRAKRSSIEGRRGDSWRARLQAPPVDGAANEALIDLLAKTLGVARRDITIVSGERSRQKRVRIAGVDSLTAERLLNRAAG